MKELLTISSRRRGINRFSFSVMAFITRAPEHGRHPRFQSVTLDCWIWFLLLICRYSLFLPVSSFLKIGKGIFRLFFV